jgi:AraC family transcriptional regulator, transcriptional activator of pobA
MTDLKTFEFHRFVERLIHTDNNLPYIVADESNFKDAPIDYPYRNYFYGIALVYEGERTLRVGIQDFTLKAGDLLVIGPSMIRQWLDSRWDIKQTALFFTPSLFTAPINAHFLSDSPIFRQGIQHVISLEESVFQNLHQIFEALKNNQSSSKIVAALTLAIIETVESLHPENQIVNHKVSRKQQITKSFCSLINTHYLENKEVNFYADKLNITPKYLSEVIKDETGKSPKNLIEQLLMQEAKSLLKQISYWLGFDDPSYFTKAFKVSENLTPFEYRGS